MMIIITSQWNSDILGHTDFCWGQDQTHMYIILGNKTLFDFLPLTSVWCIKYNFMILLLSIGWQCSTLIPWNLCKMGILDAL